MPAPQQPAPVLAITALASIGTGVIWSGIAFIAERQYGFGERDTLVLYLVLGGVYVLGARGAGRFVLAAQRRVSPRAIIGGVLVLQAFVAALPLATRQVWVLWFTAIAFNVLASVFWPLIESYMTAGRHGRSMRSAIGLWNLVWTSSVALSMVLMAPLLASRPSDSIAMLAVCNAIALLFVPLLRREPAPHDAATNLANVTPDYPRLLVAFRVLLLLSYLVTWALTPLLPFLIADLLDEPGEATFAIAGVEASWATIVAATWMVSRTLSVTAMWRMRFWHGSWRTVHVGGAALAIGFALTLAASTLPLALLGLALLGGGAGIIYYGAIYYAMSVGRAEVDAGGKHEAIIGLGYALGPAAGLAGVLIAGASESINEPSAIIGVVWAILLVGGLLAWRLTRVR